MTQMNIHPSFKHNCIDKRKCYNFQQKAVYLHTYIQMLSVTIFSNGDHWATTTEICSSFNCHKLSKCLFTLLQLLLYKTKFGWPLSLLPGMETLNPWNFTTDRRIVILGGLLGHLFILT